VSSRLRPWALRITSNPWPALAALAVGGVIALHLVALGTSPPGLYVDEASVGYNAWAVAHTAHDEHGHLLPFYFEAFGEYKNPVYIYALAPLTLVLPLTPYVVRLPAALFGLLACAMLALFARVVTGSRTAAVLTFLVAGVTPWLTQESRLGFEVVSMLALLCVMLWCLSRAVATDSWRWYAAAGAALGLSTFAYSTGRAFTLALILALGLAFGVGARSRAWGASLVAPVLALLVLAGYNSAHAGAITARFNSISIGFDNPALPTLVQRFADNYIQYWSVPFLFTHGDANPRHNTGFGGMLLVTTVPLLLAGMLVCLRRIREPLPRFLVIGALLAPIPAALTAEGTPHSLRAAVMLPFLLAFMAYGLGALLPLLRTRRLAAAVLAAAVLVETGGYVVDMFTAYPSRALTAFDTGEAPAVQRAVELAAGHEVYVSSSLEGASIQSLFALHPDPPSEQDTADSALATVHIHIADIGNIDAVARPGDMMVLSPNDRVPAQAQVVWVDRRTLSSGPVEAYSSGPGTVDLVVIAREGGS
jgi:4-amino-4-deoxy-L-arabinose transferase-like glycosyltransferase